MSTIQKESSVLVGACPTHNLLRDKHQSANDNVKDRESKENDPFETIVEAARNREVAELCEYQRRALDALEQELIDIDSEIARTDALVIESDNRVQALVGLVRKRQAFDPRLAGSGQQIRDSRASSRQRRWKKTGESEVCDTVNHGNGADVLGCKVEQSAKCLTIGTAGTIYTEFSKRFEAPRQSFQGPAGAAVVALQPYKTQSAGGRLEDISKDSRIWLLYWLDRNAGFWREKVRPPRARGGWRVGVFATRSPHRPTPVGLSLAEVVDVDIERWRIHVRGVDILDETPLLAWKRYDPNTEAHEATRSGWLDDKDKLQPLYYDEIANSNTTGETQVMFTSDAVEVLMNDDVREKLAYVDGKSTIDLFAMLRAALSRITHVGQGHVATLDGKSERRSRCDSHSSCENLYPVGAWRIWYTWDETLECIRILDVTSGIRPEVLQDEGAIDREVREHKDFLRMFGSSSKPRC
jgi:tRNA-Thr(GGU) m(6)t(6)A37 methyltransferase TsaA